MAAPNASSPPPSSTATANVITLQILSPAPEVTGGRITFQSIPLDTTISQLKARLQNSIPAQPPPERQRLIYRGRALVDGSLSLKNVFQSELDVNNTSSNHTLHLVLPPTPPSNNASEVPPVTAAIPPATSAPPVPPLAHQPHHGPHFPHQAIAQAQAAQTNLQNQLNLLQQQLLMNNPVHIPAEQMAQMQAQQHQRLAQQMALHQQQQHQHQHHHAQQEQTGAHAGMQDTHNPDHATHVNPTQSSQTSQGHHSGAPLSMGPTTTTVHEGVGPNGSRMRVVVNETVNYHVSRQGTPALPGTVLGQPSPASAPFHTPPNAVPNFSFFGPSGGPLPPFGFPLPHPHSPVTSGRPPSASARGQPGNSTASQAASATTTAWLVSTPLGPQALVFAPGHGYFSSASIPATAQPTTSTRSTSHHGTRHQRHSSNDHVGHTPGQPNNPPLLPAVNGANAAQAQAVARPGERQQRQANNDENDMFRLIFQRGWLFLRLYIFMFVLSEPGTWRRWFLLAVAVIVCLLPRENPLRDLANRIRAHIDGLIPIVAAPEQRQRGQEAQDGGHAAGNDGQVRPVSAAQQPSPEQAAARIIRQNQERRNHGIVRDTIFRVERAMALFLASLVPGVGERHVRAREEARREAERVENERLAAENARAAGEVAKTEGKATPDGTEQRQETQGEPGTSSSGEPRLEEADDA